MNPQPSASIQLATSIAQIQQCFPVMSQLRSHLQADNFAQQVQAQRSTGYQLAYIYDDRVAGVAGFNLATNLAWGKYLYLADLVVNEGSRSQGYGQALFTWLIKYAQDHNCQQFHLDSGYLIQKININQQQQRLYFFTLCKYYSIQNEHLQSPLLSPALVIH